MHRKSIFTGKALLLACLPFLALAFSMPATAAGSASSTPKPGRYCPGKDILRVVAEELSVSLDLTMRSRAAHMDKDLVTTINELSAVGTTLHLAASRGAAARSVLLIDAVIQAKTGSDYTRMLTWFPLLHSSLLTLPDSATVSAADNFIGLAEDATQDGKGEKPMEMLRQARHLLACDDLDIPLQAAIQAQTKLMHQASPKTPVKNSDYDTLLDSLHNALAYTLKNSEMQSALSQ